MLHKVLLVVICVQLCSATIEVYHLDSLLLSIPNPLFRTKRESQQDCMKNCLTSMQNDLKSNMPNAQVNGNNVKLDLKPSDVTIFCPKVYEPIRTCMPKCSNDELRFSVETAFGPLNYICVENYDGATHDFACADKMLKADQEICSKPCASLNETSATSSSNADSQMNVKMTAKCKQSKCIFDCQIAEVKQKCDEKSVKFIKGLTKSGLESGQKLLTHAKKTFPEECVKFIASLS